MKKANKKHYFLFIDESGSSNLNHAGEYFVMTAIAIESEDFSIIQGYLRLLKRKFLGDDLINLHMTDLCERPYMKFRRLLKPNNRVNSFLSQLILIVLNVPFRVGIYYVNKNKIRRRFNYTPSKRKTPPSYDPYAETALAGFRDFGNFLESEKASGEVVVESRFLRDGGVCGLF